MMTWYFAKQSRKVITLRQGHASSASVWFSIQQYMHHMLSLSYLETCYACNDNVTPPSPHCCRWRCFCCCCYRQARSYHLTHRRSILLSSQSHLSYTLSILDTSALCSLSIDDSTLPTACRPQARARISQSLDHPISKPTLT